MVTTRYATVERILTKELMLLSICGQKCQKRQVVILFSDKITLAERPAEAAAAWHQRGTPDIEIRRPNRSESRILLQQSLDCAGSSD
jgi:hypothetical protein